MTTPLKPYPKMKDSGVEWLGEVPEHWEVRRGKNLFKCIDVRSKTGDEELLTVSSNRGVVPRKTATVTMFKAESYIGYKLCWPNDLAVNSLWAWAGGLGVSNHHGIISTAYSVYRPNSSTHPRFIHELVRSKPFHRELRVRSKGVWTSRLQLTDDSFLSAPFPLPPFPEQTAIDRYLDYMDRRIRRLIRTKRKLITLLNEQKQAIIHHAVTRGLDPNVPLKDSGVEWLGMVPEHWDVVPLKRAFINIEYGISDSAIDNGTIPILTMGNIKNGAVSIPNNGGVNNVDPSLFLRDKDLLFNRTNSAELVAKVGLFRSISQPVTFASYLVRLRPKITNIPEFLNFLLNNVKFLTAARKEAIPSLHQSNLNPTRYGRLSIPLPGTSEQSAIVEYLDQATSTLDTAITRAQREIDLLTEYRTRLIADVVTGKVDVREVAAGLPEVDPLAGVDEVEDGLNGDDEDVTGGVEGLAEGVGA